MQVREILREFVFDPHFMVEPVGSVGLLGVARVWGAIFSNCAWFVCEKLAMILLSRTSRRQAAGLILSA